MFVFFAPSDRKHDLLILCEPNTDLLTADADMFAQWIAQQIETMYPSTGSAPHALMCGMFNNKYAAVIHQHSCCVNSFAMHSTFLRRGLLVAQEQAAPAPIFNPKEVAENLKTSHHPDFVKAVGVSAIQPLFADELWTILHDSSQEWRHETAWLSTCPPDSTTADVANAFGWPQRNFTLSEQPDADPFSTL